LPSSFGNNNKKKVMPLANDVRSDREHESKKRIALSGETSKESTTGEE